jgi:hypothetical protein
MTRRDLVTLLYWLDRMPPSKARWEVEWLVLGALERLQSSALLPVCVARSTFDVLSTR